MPHESDTMKILFPALMLCLACAVPTVAAARDDQGSTALSNASGLIAEGSATVVGGSLSAVAASGTVVVESVQVAGNASIVVLRGVSNAAGATLRLSGDAIAGASLVAGGSVALVAVSTGYVLVAAGEVLAFVPNEIGRALLHHTRVSV